jgi:hypothetical protein
MTETLRVNHWHQQRRTVRETPQSYRRESQAAELIDDRLLKKTRSKRLHRQTYFCTA